MTFPATARGLGLVSLAFALGACGGEQAEAESKAPKGQAVPPALLEQAWQVRLSDAAARAPFEAHAGWGYVFQRGYDEALPAFAADQGQEKALARMHLEHAAFYREAARLAANALAQVYGTDRQPEDPVEVDYLVGVSRALLGDPAGAKSALAALPAGTSVEAQAQIWRSWLDQGATWPPDAGLVGFPGQPGAVTPGQAPGLGSLPQYRFAERVAADAAAGAPTREVGSTDPTSLYLLSRWHEAAARQADPADDAVISQLIGVWRLPPEPSAAADLLPITDDWLFLSPMMSAEDAAFLAAAAGGKGLEAVEAWKGRSALAAAVAPAIVDGKVNPDLMIDQAAWLGSQVEEAMVARSGREEPFHRAFADLARVGALRAAMVVADASGEVRDAGILRINALDRSVESAADPVFFMSIAAWDTGNRNALRAQELIHGLLSRFPAAEAARLPLDALHIRLGRNAAPATAVF